MNCLPCISVSQKTCSVALAIITKTPVVSGSSDSSSTIGLHRDVIGGRNRASIQDRCLFLSSCHVQFLGLLGSFACVHLMQLALHCPDKLMVVYSKEVYETP